MFKQGKMLKQGRKILLGAGVLAALSFGGSALAAAGAAPTPVTPTMQESTTAVDNDQVQSGDQTTPDTAAEAAGTETADGAQGSQDTETQDGAQGAAGSAAQEASGSESSGSESGGSEVAGNDGPGGHADEPGNPNADHQASGQSQE